MSYINNFINLNNVNNVINRENNYNYYRNNVNYWNEIIYRIHEMNVDEMIVPVHNRDYLLGVMAAASESSSACARASVLETPVEIFKRLDISVTKADDKVQAQVQEEKKKTVVQFAKKIM